MRIGSLFSGIGGIELGLERAGVGHTVWQCEQDTAAQAVLRTRWPGVPVYDDVRAIGAANVQPVDVLCGGFPCQDISVAGSGAGLSGARSGLWFEYLRLIRELRPRYVVAENVAALVTRGLDVVLGGLAKSGYDALWLPLRASDVGAPHRRERIFIVAWRVADSDSKRALGQPDSPERREVERAPADGAGGGVGHADRSGLEGRSLLKCERSDQWIAREASAENMADSESERQFSRLPCRATKEEPWTYGARADVDRTHEWPPAPNDANGWASYAARHPGRAPAVRGQLNPGFVESIMGFPDGWTDVEFSGRRTKRAERLKMLGNSVVPQCAEVVGHVLRGLQ